MSTDTALRPRDEAPQSVRAVERALDILLLMGEEDREMSITALADKVGLSKSTVHRLLTALQNKGFIKQNPENHRYSLGLALLHLGQLVADRLDLKNIARPIMDRLQKETGETVNLNIVQEGRRVCIERVESQHDVRHFVEIGKSVALYAGASGKVIMAFMDPEEVEAIIESTGLQAHTPNTITDPDAFREELERIRRRGYATSVCERVEGAASISAPVRDRYGKVIASLTVSGPAFRFTPERFTTFADLLVAAAAELSRSLGYRAETE